MTNKPPPPKVPTSSVGREISSKGMPTPAGREISSKGVPAPGSSSGNRPTAAAGTVDKRKPTSGVAAETSSSGRLAPGRPAKTGEGRKLTEEEVRKAAAEGKKIVAYSPTEIEGFLRGHRTLAEIEGISKEEQYRMAELGYRFLNEGKLAQARDVFFGLVALDPFDAYFLTCLGAIHQREKKDEEAERIYSRALEINPFQTTARTHRGELRAMSGRVKDAVDDLTRAIKDDPEAKDPAVRRAALLLKAIESKLTPG